MAVLASKSIEAESPIVSDHHINTLPFHVFLASHESRLTVSKPGRSQKCELGARNFSELGGVKIIIMPAQLIPPIFIVDVMGVTGCKNDRTPKLEATYGKSNWRTC